MREYKVSKDTIKTNRKRGLIISIIIPIFFLLLGLMQLNEESDVDILACIIVGVSVLIVYFGAVYIGIIAGEKVLLKTSLILEDDYFILKKKANSKTPIMEQLQMNYEDIKSIKQTNSGIVVKGKKTFSKIVIPKVLDNYDEILSHIEQKVIMSKINS